MSLNVPQKYLNDYPIHYESGDKSPSIESTFSSFTNQTYSPSTFHRAVRLQAASSIDVSTEFTDDDPDFDENASTKENYRFGSQTIRKRLSRHSSFRTIINSQRYTRSSLNKTDLLVIQAPPPGSLSIAGRRFSLKDVGHTSTAENHLSPISPNTIDEVRGQTLFHLAARLGHDQILRLLLSETSQASTLINCKGQTPLLTAIAAGSTSSAVLLMEADPRSIIARDINGSSVFHYACKHCNDSVLYRAIALLKRLHSTSDRINALRCITEGNNEGKTPFHIAIENGQLKCVKHIVLSSWLEENLDMRILIDAASMKYAIDQDQINILTFFVSQSKRFAYIIHLLIDLKGKLFNLLEYAILLKKKDVVRLFISVRIPVEQYHFRCEYEQFLKHYNVSFTQSSSSSFYQTPIQRMLTTPECVSLVPLLLEQFVSKDGIDLSIVDDCLYAQPNKTRCIFGRTKDFSTDKWHQQHPLTLIAKADSKDVYDHRLVRLCVDLKFNLFGNFLYLLVLVSQSTYVALYTGIALGSPTPAAQETNYYEMVNYTCYDLCITLANNLQRPATDQPALRALRLILLIVSVLALLKELFQLVTQQEKYFRRFYVNLIELHMYISAIIYSVDINECTRQTGIRCSTQWMTGGIGLLSVWTSLLLVVMNGIKFGKHGLLFVTVYVTFLKFIAVYFMIWIGYILAFYMICKDIMAQFRFFNFVPKLLVMFIGEYDMGGTFFTNNVLKPGAEAALILYSAYIFTMFIVMMNIMGGLAVADVKEHRLNAKREHLRGRIGVVLGLQARFGRLCEAIGSSIRKLSKNARYVNIMNKLNLLPMKYHLRQLKIFRNSINIPHNLHPSHFSYLTAGTRRENVINLRETISSSTSSLPTIGIFEQVHTETGYYSCRDATQDDSLFNEGEGILLI